MQWCLALASAEIGAVTTSTACRSDANTNQELSTEIESIDEIMTPVLAVGHIWASWKILGVDGQSWAVQQQA